VFHFPRLDPTAAPWPSVIHEWDGPAVYHLAGGRDGGPGDDRKIGEHATGADAAAAETAASETAAPAGKRAIDPTVRARMIDYVQRWLPGLESTPRNETTCLYTETPSQDFVLDRVGSVVVCSPCSGHGAKFAPLIGEFVAALVLGDDTRPVPDRFRLATHLAGLAGPVSL
jgi:sarcosine oxidase